MRYPGIVVLVLISALLVACGGTEAPVVGETDLTPIVEAPTASDSGQAPVEVAPVVADDEPILLSGSGAALTDPVSVPWDDARVVISHDGSRNFVVTADQAGAQSLLVNVIGAFEGARPLTGAGEVTFDVDADGAWTLTIEPLGKADGMVLSGFGPAVTDIVSLPLDYARAVIAHDGSRNFVVTASQTGSESLLVNVIGAFEGARPLFGAGDVYFDIDADGEWTVTVEPLGRADGAEFSGSGSAVSGLFEPPASGPWLISHDGSANFVVRLHCDGSTALVQNTIGEVDASTEVAFGPGECFWEVEADGNWSLVAE